MHGWTMRSRLPRRRRRCGVGRKERVTAIQGAADTLGLPGNVYLVTLSACVTSGVTGLECDYWARAALSLGPPAPGGLPGFFFSRQRALGA